MKNRRKTLLQLHPVIQQDVKVLPVLLEEKVNIPKEIGKYLLDISKLIVGGAVITTAIDMTSDKLIVIVISIGCAITIGLGGIYIIIINNKKL